MAAIYRGVKRVLADPDFPVLLVGALAAGGVVAIAFFWGLPA